MQNRTFRAAAVFAAMLTLLASRAEGQAQTQVGAAQQQQAQGGAIAEIPLNATLLGADIVGDPGSSITGLLFAFQLRPATKEICYEVKSTNAQPITGAHIHKAAKGVNGPSVFTLVVEKDTVAKACSKAEDAVFDDIVANPSGYYVQIHNQAFPKGAARGQLAKPPEK